MSRAQIQSDLPVEIQERIRNIDNIYKSLIPNLHQLIKVIP